jgi:hypothetical protein
MPTYEVIESVLVEAEDEEKALKNARAGDVLSMKDPVVSEVFPKSEIEQIVERRINVGIAGSAEAELYFKGDLDDGEYTPEFKRQLLAEVEEAEKRAKAQPKRESNADWLTPKPAKAK